MSKNAKIKLWIMLIATPILLFLIYGTDLIAPKYDYIRLKNGEVFRNKSVRWPNDIDVVIDGKYYTKFDIDSLSR